MEINKIYNGDCLDILKTLPDNIVDSIVTDPPYELGFMGKSWDNTGIANNVEMWKECLRVLKPGGHLLSFSGTRTYHRMAVAIEDAGFEVRDMIEWVYGSGFPKSLNIAKMLDKMEGVEHPKNTIILYNGSMSGANYTRNKMDVQSDLAKQWEGFGTALKPAHEPICMARKPLAEKTVAENCLKWGTGGLNIDWCRIPFVNKKDIGDINRFNGLKPYPVEKGWNKNNLIIKEYDTTKGRFPANLIHDNSEEVIGCFPESKSQGHFNSKVNMVGHTLYEGGFNDFEQEDRKMNDSGNASRFFKSIIYTAKASKSERNKGLDEKEKVVDCDRNPECYSANVPFNRNSNPKINNHPTVKPIALMEYLIKMVTFNGGIVLDPFVGSGTTAIAAIKNNFKFIGIEKESEYVKIAEARLKPYLEQTKLNNIPQS